MLTEHPVAAGQHVTLNDTVSIGCWLHGDWAVRSGSASFSRRMGTACVSVALALTVSGWARGETTALRTTDFEFLSHGLTLSGVISQPAHGEARALIVFVHGYGTTDVRGGEMYLDLRSRFARLGIASVIWDKPGQGRSEGAFDINQPVASSAQEVLDAVAHLRTHRIPGSHRIGLWGISRAGWIAPLALTRDPDIKFWISVSGVTAEDNYFYLLKANLPHEGSTVEEADVLMQEWKRGRQLFRDGGSYEDYRAATKRVRANPYIRRMIDLELSRDRYELEQAKLRAAGKPPPVDEETGMPLYIEQFDVLLGNLAIDVLALFGERDLNVDWSKTRALYESTLGQNDQASLTIHTFPAGNHVIDVAETGSLREMAGMSMRRKCDGYYTAQLEWLKEHVLDDGHAGRIRDLADQRTGQRVRR